jgi:hypothetical protein
MKVEAYDLFDTGDFFAQYVHVNTRGSTVCRDGQHREEYEVEEWQGRGDEGCARLDERSSVWSVLVWP